MNGINEIISKYTQIIINQLTISVTQIIISLYNYAYKELFDEANQMYKTFIDHYYFYKTKSYWRHGVGRGTGTGQNLYLGNKIKLIEGDNPQLIIDFTGEGMKPYRFDSTDAVLEQVMSGVRGVPKDRHGKSWLESWSGSYSGKYFSAVGTTMDNAFESFDAQFDNLIKGIVDKKYYLYERQIKEEQKRIMAEIMPMLIDEIIPILVQNIVNGTL